MAVVIAGEPHRVTEAELYVRAPNHVDPFTHGDPIQQQLGQWYFHRSGGTYRGGTYKGLDIAFGAGGAYAAVLLRGIVGESLIDGPCLVVEHILARTRCASIDELVARHGLAIEDATSALRVEPASHAIAIHATARIGLTLKKGNTLERRRYLARPYRFLSEPARIKKGKPHLVCALHAQGRAAAEIAEVAALRRSIVDAYVAAYEAGRTMSPAAFTADLSGSQICSLLGACSNDV